MRAITILFIYFPVFLLSVISIFKDRFHSDNEVLNSQTWPLTPGIILVGVFSTSWIIKPYWDLIPFLRNYKYDTFGSFWHAIVLALIYFFLHFIYRQSFLKLFCFKHSHFRFILKLCLILTIINVVTIFSLNFEFILGLKKTEIEFFKSMDIKTFGLYYFIAVTIAPISEETLFRGLLYVPLLRKTGRPVALILTSIIFTEQHFHLLPGIRIFVGGIILAWLYDRRGSLIDPIMFHIFINSWLIIYYLSSAAKV
jgi:membrane protease YdiL (CAAX protease family)